MSHPSRRRRLLFVFDKRGSSVEQETELQLAQSRRRRRRRIQLELNRRRTIRVVSEWQLDPPDLVEVLHIFTAHEALLRPCQVTNQFDSGLVLEEECRWAGTSRSL